VATQNGLNGANVHTDVTAVNSTDTGAYVAEYFHT
jgi:hypothetical protein